MDIPNDVNRLIINKLSYPEIINLCQTNKRFATLCRNDNLWKNLLDRDFGVKFKNQTNRESYEYVYKNIQGTVDDLVENKLIADPRYLNIKIIKTDMFNIIAKFIKSHHLKGYSQEDFNKLKRQIVAILSALPIQIIESDAVNFTQYELDNIDNELEGLFIELEIENVDD